METEEEGGGSGDEWNRERRREGQRDDETGRKTTFLRDWTEEELKAPVVRIRGPYLNTSLPHEEPPKEWRESSGNARTKENVTTEDGKMPVATVDVIDASLPSSDEWERTKAWQDERLERRLQGRYEDARANARETVERNKSVRVNLDSIRIEGAVFTRPSFLQRIIQPCLDQGLEQTVFEKAVNRLLPKVGPPPKGDTLESALETVRHLHSALMAHGIFTSITPSIGPSWSPFGSAEDVALSLDVKEASRYLLKTSTDFGNGEGSARVIGRIRNALGGAETVEVEFGGGTRSSNNYKFRFETPILANPLAKFEALAFGSTRNNQWYASHDEKIHGARLLYKALTGLTLHQFAYDVQWRNVFHLSSIVSKSIRREAGDSIKSSFSHTMTKDKRDDPLMPTRGTMLKTTTELAKFGGDVAFVKFETEGQLALSLADRYHLAITGQVGLLRPLILGGQTITCSDRFFLGGSNSVRGFKTNSLGPRDRLDYLGGDSYWASGLSFFTPVPGVPKTWDMRTHFFINAGRLLQSDQSKKYQSLSGLLQTPSISAGVGIAYRHPAARIELNFVVPIAASFHDGVRKGIEVGIGASFL